MGSSEEMYLLITWKLWSVRSSSAIERFRHHSVPVVLFVIVAVVAFDAPPLSAGAVTRLTSEFTMVVFVLSVWAGFPYALLVAVGPLSLLSRGIATFAAPRTSGEEARVYSRGAALRHVIAGVSYARGATVVGAHGIGVQMTLGREMTVLPPSMQPSFLVVVGVIVGVAFVGLQLWRYDTAPGTLSRRNILGTVGLGVLLALSPRVAYLVAWNIIA